MKTMVEILIHLFPQSELDWRKNMKVLQLCVGNKLFVGVGVGHSVYSGSIIVTGFAKTGLIAGIRNYSYSRFSSAK